MLGDNISGKQPLWCLVSIWTIYRKCVSMIERNTRLISGAQKNAHRSFDLLTSKQMFDIMMQRTSVLTKIMLNRFPLAGNSDTNLKRKKRRIDFRCANTDVKIKWNREKSALLNRCYPISVPTSRFGSSEQTVPQGETDWASALTLDDFRYSSTWKIFHAAFDLCSANGNIPDTLFDKPDFGSASAVFQNRTMMIEAESDSLMQYNRSPAARWTGGVLPSRWMWMMTRRFWVTKGGIRIARTAERSKRRS